MLDVTISLKCNCGSKAEIVLTESEMTREGELDLSESIENNSNGLFYCRQNQPDGMNLVCVKCGRETKLAY